MSGMVQFLQQQAITRFVNDSTHFSGEGRSSCVEGKEYVHVAVFSVTSSMVRPPRQRVYGKKAGLVPRH